MKSQSFFLLAAALTGPLLAQPPVQVEKTVTETVAPGQRVVEETVVEKRVPVAPGAYDPASRLSVVPRALPVDPTVPVAPGGTTTTETTETTTTRVGGRVYNTERNVVVVEGRELPYTTIPVLFVKETAELLDSESRVALEQTAAAINDVVRTNPTATFDIEGHTSTDGATDMNMNLSAARARRVHQELTQRYGVPAAALTAHGYGETYPNYPNGSEVEMSLDRRVLVVRLR
jgi:outer membrane protein OmpA-like peptidoglycan-associated protein